MKNHIPAKLNAESGTYQDFKLIIPSTFKSKLNCTEMQSS